MARRWWLASLAFDRNYWYVSVAIGLLGTGLIFYLARADFIRLLIPFFFLVVGSSFALWFLAFYAMDSVGRHRHALRVDSAPKRSLPK